MVIQEFQEILHESAAFVDKLRRAVEDVSTLRSSKQRLDAQRAEVAAASDQCREVEILLADTVKHMGRLRRAAPELSDQEVVRRLTRKFVLCLPFPQPGEWIRGSIPVHSTFKTDENVDATSVEELQPHPNPTKAFHIKRTYYANDAGSSREKKKEALRIVREMRQYDTGEEHTGAAESHEDDCTSLYLRAAQVSKQVISIKPPCSLGRMDQQLIHYLSLSTPALFSISPQQQQQQQQHTVAEHEQPRLNPKTKQIIERAVTNAMQQRMDEWAATYNQLQKNLGTTRVPYSATWITIKPSRIAKFKRRRESLYAKMLEIFGEGAEKSVVEEEGKKRVLLEALATYEDFEADLYSALSHCLARMREGKEARQHAEEGVVLASATISRMQALGTNVSWLDKVRERASVAEKRYNMWRKASHELDRYISDHSTTSLILDGGEGEGSKLKSREKEAKYELRQAEKAVEDVLELAQRWVVIIEQTHHWALGAPAEHSSWGTPQIADRLCAISRDFEAVFEAEKLFSEVVGCSNLSAVTPDSFNTAIPKWLDKLSSRHSATLLRTRQQATAAAPTPPAPAQAATGAHAVAEVAAASASKGAASEGFGEEERGDGGRGRERLSMLLLLLRSAVRPHFANWIAAEEFQECARSIGQRLTAEEAAQIVFRVGGFEAATALYRDVFEGALRPLQDASNASNADDESPSFYKWHARTLRAEFLGVGVDGKPDLLADADTGEVVWERAGAYCHIDALVASDSLLKLCSLTASLALPLGLTYAHELPDDSASSSTPCRTAASSASAAALYLGEEEEDSSPVSFMTPGAEGLAEVARILLGCGWGRRGTKMPTYEEMRRYGARKAATAIRLVHGGLRQSASKLWLQRHELGLDDDFVLEPLPFMVTDAASGEPVWAASEGGWGGHALGGGQDASDMTVLHEILADARTIRGSSRAGRGGVLLTTGGEKLEAHYLSDAYQSLDSILHVFEMLWEDLEVVEEEFVPMYCELEAHGFKAAADSILLTHGGMRTIADMFDRKGPWLSPVRVRRERRLRAPQPIPTWQWTAVLRVVKQVADESVTPQMMPTYKMLKDEGLQNVALALRNRSTMQTRPSRRVLVPQPTSGRFWAAQQLGLLTTDRKPSASSFPTERGDDYGVVLDRQSLLEQYADAKSLRQAIWECARRLPASAPEGQEERYSKLYIPSYADMVRTGYSVLADAIRSRKGGMLALSSDIWGGARTVIKGNVNDNLRLSRRLLHVDALEQGSHQAVRQHGKHVRQHVLLDEPSDDEEAAMMCGFLEGQHMQEERRRSRVLPPTFDSDSDDEYMQQAHSAAQPAAETEQRLDLPYVHMELDLGPKVEKKSGYSFLHGRGEAEAKTVDKNTGGWRRAWHFHEPWHVERAIQDLAFELSIFDRHPTYREIRQHGWGPLADCILQSRHRSDCPRSGRVVAESQWFQEPCYCLYLFLTDSERSEKFQKRLWQARQAVLVEGEECTVAARDLSFALAQLDHMAVIQHELRTHNNDIKPVVPFKPANELLNEIDVLIQDLDVEPHGSPNAGMVSMHQFLHVVKWSETWIAFLKKANISIKNVLLRAMPLMTADMTPDQLPIHAAVSKKSLSDALWASYKPRKNWWRTQILSTDPETDAKMNGAAVSALASHRRGMSGVRCTYSPVPSNAFLKSIFDRIASRGGLSAEEGGGHGSGSAGQDNLAAAHVHRHDGREGGGGADEGESHRDIRGRQLVDAYDVYVVLHQLGVGVSRHEAERMMECWLNKSNPCLTFAQFDAMLRKSPFAKQLGISKAHVGGVPAPSSLAVLPAPGTCSELAHDQLALDLWSTALDKLLNFQKNGRGLNNPEVLQDILRQRKAAQNVTIPLKVMIPRLLLAPPPLGEHHNHKTFVSKWDGTLDLVFVLDGSEDMGNKMWKSVRRLVQDCLRRFRFEDEGRVSCGFVQFKCDLSVEQLPSTYMDTVMSNLQEADLRSTSGLRKKAQDGDRESAEQFRRQILAETSALPRQPGADAPHPYYRSYGVCTKEHRVSLADALDRAFLFFFYDDPSGARLFARPGARHVIVLVTNNETLMHNANNNAGASLMGVYRDMDDFGVEVMVLADPHHCPSTSQTEVMKKLATSPVGNHFFKLPFAEQTYPFVLHTPWDLLLQQFEEFVDMSSRPRHCAGMLQLNKGGAKELSTTLRHLSRSVDVLFREDRSLVIPQIESGVALVGQELGLLQPATRFQYGEHDSVKNLVGQEEEKKEDKEEEEEEKSLQTMIQDIMMRNHYDKTAISLAVQQGFLPKKHDRVVVTDTHFGCEDADQEIHALLNAKRTHSYDGDTPDNTNAGSGLNSIPDGDGEASAPLLHDTTTRDKSVNSLSTSLTKEKHHLQHLARATKVEVSKIAEMLCEKVPHIQANNLGYFKELRKTAKTEGASARLLGTKLNGISTSTKGVKVGGWSSFAPSNAGMGTRKRVIPRSDSSGLASSMSARSCSGAILPTANTAQKVFAQSLREACYVEAQRLSLNEVLEVLHVMAGRPDVKGMILLGYHPDDIAVLRLLPNESQLQGAALHHVTRAITSDLGGWDVVIRASDPHALHTWTSHQVARFLDSFRDRLGAPDVIRYRRRALATSVTGQKLLDMSLTTLARDLDVHDPTHRQIIYNRVEMMRTLKAWSPDVHGPFSRCYWPRDLKYKGTTSNLVPS